MTLFKNITDIQFAGGAKGDSSTDDTAAFIAFRDWAVTQSDDIVLTIPTAPVVPTGEYMLLSGSGATQYIFGGGIKNLIIEGTGATLNTGATGAFNLGVSYTDVIQNNLPITVARVASVSAGSSSVTLLDPTQAGLFSAGNWTLITGFDCQGDLTAGGDPPNPMWYEWLQITSVVTNIDGSVVVGFSTPLENTYLSTWPHYFSGGADRPDSGGPATLYQINQIWDTSLDYRGLTFIKNDACNANGRSIIFRNCTFSPGLGLFSSLNKTFEAYGSSLNGFGESDKISSQVIFDNTYVKDWLFQSSSPAKLIIRNGSVVDRLNGTPTTLYASDSTINTLIIGCQNWGRTDEIVLSNCVIPAISDNAVLEKGTGHIGVNKSWSIIGTGIIVIPNADFTTGMFHFPPGTHCFWSRGQSVTEGHFKILSVTQDVNNTYLTTDFNGTTWPIVPLFGGTDLYIQIHPAPKATFINCTGGDEANDLSQMSPGSPLYSYTKRDYTAITGVFSVPLWGNVIQAKFTVNKLYGGGNPSELCMTVENTSVFGNPSVVNWIPQIDVKAGLAGRVVTATPDGMQQGAIGSDDVALPIGAWLSSALSNVVAGSAYSPDISTSGSDVSVTVEILTDQGITNLQIVPDTIIGIASCDW